MATRPRGAGKRPRSADERDIGIAEYVSPTIPGIGGELKRHAADFEVHELELSGGCAVALPEEETLGEEDEQEPAPILRFVLRKERMDTLAVIGALSKQLGLPVRRLVDWDGLVEDICTQHVQYMLKDVPWEEDLERLSRAGVLRADAVASRSQGRQHARRPLGCARAGSTRASPWPCRRSGGPKALRFALRGLAIAPRLEPR